VVDEYAAHRYVPLNLRVQAAQLGEAGVSIGVIAMNYDTLATELKAMTADFIASARLLFAAINKGLFLIGVAKIQREASEQFQSEGEAGGMAPSDEIALLETQRRAYENFAALGLSSIVSEAQRFEQACVDLKRGAAALETARIMAKVESARLKDADKGLSGLLGELERYQASMTQGLQKMLAMCRRIETDAGGSVKVF
jgi:hypothetical protein